MFYIKSKLLLIEKIDGYRNKSQSIKVLFCYEHKPNKNKTLLFYLSKSVTIKYTVCTYIVYVCTLCHSRCTSINFTNRNKTTYGQFEK